MSEITCNLTSQQQFEQNLMERLRKDIGELLPDEVLSEMIKSQLEAMLLKERPVAPTSFYSNTPTPPKPPLLQELIKELLLDAVKEEIKVWLADNDEAVRELIKAQLSKGLASSLVKALDSVFMMQYQQLTNGLYQTITELKNKSY